MLVRTRHAFNAKVFHSGIFLVPLPLPHILILKPFIPPSVDHLNELLFVWLRTRPKAAAERMKARAATTRKEKKKERELVILVCVMLYVERVYDKS